MDGVTPAGPAPRPAPQEAVDDILCALKMDQRATVPELRSLKPPAQALLTQALSSRCRTLLCQGQAPGTALSPDELHGLQAAGEALIALDSAQCSGHILLVDVLSASGM